MNKNIKNICKPTKQRIDDIVMPSYTELSKKCISYIKELKCPKQYIADMLRNLADAIITSYPKVKDNIKKFCFFYE